MGLSLRHPLLPATTGVVTRREFAAHFRKSKRRLFVNNLHLYLSTADICLRIYVFRECCYGRASICRPTPARSHLIFAKRKSKRAGDDSGCRKKVHPTRPRKFLGRMNEFLQTRASGSRALRGRPRCGSASSPCGDLRLLHTRISGNAPSVGRWRPAMTNG
jgi:hypothetical protein